MAVPPPPPRPALLIWFRIKYSSVLLIFVVLQYEEILLSAIVLFTANYEEICHFTVWGNLSFYSMMKSVIFQQLSFYSMRKSVIFVVFTAFFFTFFQHFFNFFFNFFYSQLFDILQFVFFRISSIFFYYYELFLDYTNYINRLLSLFSLLPTRQYWIMAWQSEFWFWERWKRKKMWKLIGLKRKKMWKSILRNDTRRSFKIPWLWLRAVWRPKSSWARASRMYCLRGRNLSSTFILKAVTSSTFIWKAVSFILKAVTSSTFIWKAVTSSSFILKAVTSGTFIWKAVIST